MIIPDKELKNLYNLSKILGFGSSSKIPYALLFVLSFVGFILLPLLPLIFLVIVPYILYVLYLNGRRSYILLILICFLGMSLLKIFFGNSELFSLFLDSVSLIFPVIILVIVKMQLKGWIGDKEWELKYKYEHENPLNKVEDFLQ